MLIALVATGGLVVSLQSTLCEAFGRGGAVVASGVIGAVCVPALRQLLGKLFGEVSREG